jgi:hypothetical protein
MIAQQIVTAFKDLNLESQVETLQEIFVSLPEETVAAILAYKDYLPDGDLYLPPDTTDMLEYPEEAEGEIREQ